MEQEAKEAEHPTTYRRCRRGMGLRPRLLLLVVLAFLPAFLLILNNAREERLHTVNADELRAQALVRQISDAKSRALHSVHALLTVLAESPDVLKGSHDRCARRLRSVLAVEPDLANLGVTDMRGNVVCSAISFTSPINVADQAYYKRALARDDFAVGTYAIGRITDAPVLMDAHPVPADGPPQGVIFASMKLGRLGALPADTHLPAGASFTLYDSDYHLLARYPGAVHAGSRVPKSAVPVKLITGIKDYTRVVHTAVGDYLLAYTTLSGQESGKQLHATLMIPAGAAFAYADAMTYRSLTLLGIASLAVLLLAWLGGDLLVLQPVRRLTEVAGQLAAGRLEARTGLPRGHGEIGVLAGAVDTMADALQQREHESREQSQRIERLNRIYHVLSAINGAIIRIRDRNELLQEVCRIAVEEGDFTFAWVGLVDPASDWVNVVAHAGAAEEFIRNVHVSHRAEFAEGLGTAGRALRSGAYACSNDVENDPGLVAWLESFREFGIRSIASFPLIVRERITGVLVFNTSEIGFFDNDEIRLLEEVAADTSLGLEHIEREGRLSFLTNWDPLTGLPNRTLLCDRLDQSIERARRRNEHLALLVIDLINFAEINDIMGRHVGDHVLKELAVRLERVVHDGERAEELDIGIGRVGSRTFGVLLNLGDEPGRINIVAQRLLDAAKAAILVGDEDVRMSVHVGVAAFPEQGDQAHLLLRNAEFAAHSIVSGEELRFYSETLDTKAQERRRLEAALQGALERNEFFLEYQPKVDARNGQVMGAEALLRWQSPEFGRVEPDRFIPVLEETGLIDIVGEWVLASAAGQTAKWGGRLVDGFIMAVNVASSQLFADGFVARASEAVRSAGVEPTQIELEITETRLMDHAILGPERLGQLKAQGFRIAVDDFGIGYSSLSYLRDLPLDTLKIDRSFVANIVTDPGSLSIVRTVLALAKTLHLDVIAEGVENESQLGLLASEGCRHIQGFHFSRPLSSERFAERCTTPFAVPVYTDADTERTLLLVDDEHNITQSLRRALRGENYRILMAQDAAEAFELLARHRVQVVLSDLRMPVMNGTEFLRRVKLMYPKTVRMILTGYNDITTVTAAVNEGAIFKFVSKPWEDAFLRSALREAFDVAAGAAQAAALSA